MRRSEVRLFPPARSKQSVFWPTTGATATVGGVSIPSHCSSHKVKCIFDVRCIQVVDFVPTIDRNRREIAGVNVIIAMLRF